MDTLICAGGSGTRGLEAMLHLCAMGLGPAELRMFVIDSDDSNGNGTRTQTLVGRYQALHEIYGKNGPFFATRLNLLNANKTQTKLETWKPVDTNKPFSQVLNYTELSSEQQDVVHLLFTDKELQMKMDHGFLGHPSLGAAALALLPLYRDRDPLWSRFQGELQQDLNAGARVMIVGSVFGGTGAATIHPLLKYLKSEEFLGGRTRKPEVGAVALVPYFEFDRRGDRAAVQEDANEAEAARSQNFPLACRSSADYYDHLRQSNDWDFDAMFWIGDDSPKKVAYSKGGPNQNNPAHFVDLLVALYSLEFFQNGGPDKTCYYGGQMGDEDTERNRLSWKNLPMRQALRDRDGKPVDLERAIHEFHMVALAHLRFFDRLLKHSELEKRSYCVPWYKDRFGGENSLNGKEAKDDIDLLSEYLVQSYLPWWQQIHDVDNTGRIRLLNPAAWRANSDDEACKRFDNLMWPDDARKQDRTAVDKLYDGMIRVAPTAPADGRPASRYLRMLHLAVQPAVERTRSGQGSNSMA